MFYLFMFIAGIIWILIMAGVTYAINKPMDDALDAAKRLRHIPPKRDPNWEKRHNVISKDDE